MKSQTFLLLIILLISCNNNRVTKDNSSQSPDTINVLQPDSTLLEFSADKIISLEHTKWIFEIGENCINYFEFINDTAQYYNCELGYIDKDPYKIENDTITIYEYDFKSEMDTTEVYVGQLKMIVYKNKLIPVYFTRRTETGKETKEMSTRREVSYYTKI